MISRFNKNNTGLVGGKAKSLLRLTGSFLVPEAFVIEPLDELDNTVVAAFDELKVELVAVRSSAVNEDSADAAWAGQLETKLNVTRENLLEAVKACRQSSNSARAKAYAADKGIQAGGVAVIVQRMLKSRISGVAFTRHPVTGAKQTVVEVVKGLGEQLVSGQVTPDTFILEAGRAAQVNLSTDKPLATNQELLQIDKLARGVEAELGYPVDIEWAFEADTLYLLQARPITTL